MARPIKRIDRKRLRYPWPRWADGRIWRARRGTDFLCSIAGFRSALYTWAVRARKKVRVSAKGNIVEFRFFDPPRPAPPATEPPQPEPQP